MPIWLGYPRCMICGRPAGSIVQYLRARTYLEWTNGRAEVTRQVEPAGGYAPVNMAGEVRCYCPNCEFEWRSPYRGPVPVVAEQAEPGWRKRHFVVTFRRGSEDCDYFFSRLQEATCPWEAVVWAFAAHWHLARHDAAAKLEQDFPEIQVFDLERQRSLDWVEVNPPWYRISDAEEALRGAEDLREDFHVLRDRLRAIGLPPDDETWDRLNADLVRRKQTLDDLRKAWRMEKTATDDAGRTRTIEVKSGRPLPVEDNNRERVITL